MPGPIDLPQETNSGLDLLPTNNTYIAMPLKGNKGPREPEEVPVKDAVSTEAVMEWADPNVDVKLNTGDGEVQEKIHFKGGIEAFTPASIKRNSETLRGLEAEYKASEALVDRIASSPKFRNALDNEEARAAIVAALMDIVNQLDKSMPVKVED